MVETEWRGRWMRAKTEVTPISNGSGPVAPAHRRLTFIEAFGKLGIPMLLITLISMSWTVWLVCLNIAPNATANYLMDTADFDNGDFWLILRPDPVLLVFTVLCLLAILTMYGAVILRMTLWRNVIPRGNSFRDRTLSKIAIGVVLSSQNAIKAKHAWQDVTGFNGKWRKHWNTLLKVVDLTLQMLTLFRILEYGFAPTMSFGYAALIVANALSCAAFILSRSNHSAFVEVLIDTMFDMLFAVGAPIMLLAYAYTHFDFDRARARLILKMTNPGNFNRQARMMADPRQTSIFLLSFDALRTNTWSGLAVQTVMNMSFCYRLLRVVQVYSESRRHMHHSSSKTQLFTVGSRKNVAKSTATGKVIPFVALKAQARVPRVLAIGFLAVGVAAIAFTHEAIDHSTRECKAYPECAAFAYRWATHNSCPCLAYIAVVKAPKTFDEWTNPIDVTASVTALAASGDLLVLNIINRRLRVWPDELSRCKNLRHISLLYTGVEEIPSWAAGFTKLEYLNIEGKLSETNIVKMPENLFDYMPVLMNVHFGVHFHLEKLPRLNGLHNLNGLSLALLSSLAELPDISKLTKLQRLEIVTMASLNQLPNLPNGISLSTFTVAFSLPCCSGYLGECDTTLPACIGMDSTSCLPSNSGLKDLSETTQQQIAAHRSTVCSVDPLFRGVPIEVLSWPPTKEDVDKCGGVMYRECTYDTSSDWSVGHSICQNDRFQVIQCIYSDEAINLRRQEIRDSIGTPCDPEEEAWLGCPTTV